MNHLVWSRVPPEKVSRNVGGADSANSGSAGTPCANAAAPANNETANMRRNLFMVWIVYLRRKDGLSEVIKQSVPDSFESWDARRTSPPPKDCSRTAYVQGSGAGMARMGYSPPVGNLADGYFSEITCFQRYSLPLAGPAQGRQARIPRHGSKSRHDRPDFMRKNRDVIIVVGNRQNLVFVGSMGDLCPHEERHPVSRVRKPDGRLLFPIESETWAETSRSLRGMVFRADISAHLTRSLLNCRLSWRCPDRRPWWIPNYTFSAGTSREAGCRPRKTRIRPT